MFFRENTKFDNFKTVDHSKIYVQDIESALYYMIKKEGTAKVSSSKKFNY